MTQIISVITEEYVLLVSDRRLTFGDGPRQGEIFDDDTCKLVSLCNICGIGYTGLAHIANQPTHEWIAKTLASYNCHDPATASQIIQQEATRAFSKISFSKKFQIFLLSGWAHFNNMLGLRPFICLVTNAHDDSGNMLPSPKDKFDIRLKALPNKDEILWKSIGQPIRPNRAKKLKRNIKKLIQKQIGPKETLRILSDEIIFTSANEGNKTVGEKILGLCIPKKTIEKQARDGVSILLSKQPELDTPTFTYFENGYSELQQFGPTYICGETAMTDLVTENNPKRDFQSSQARYLHLPKKSS